MRSQRPLVGMLGIPPDARNDAMLYVFLLAVCLAFDGYAGAVYLTSFSQGIFDSAWRPIGRDFVNYWSAGVAISDGLILQIFDIELFHPYQERLFGQSFADHNWSYPPHMLLLVWPFGQLPYIWSSDERRVGNECVSTC